MSTWHDLATDNRESLKSLASVQAQRSHISRAYYAAYALVTHHLVRVGADFGASQAGAARLNPAHRHLKRLIRRHLAPQWGKDRAAEVCSCIGLLYSRRLQADYDPEQPIEATDVVQTKRELEKLFRYVEGKR